MLTGVCVGLENEKENINHQKSNNMKKTLMVLGLALFATMATAQTNDCTSMLDGRGTRNVETGVVQNKSVDYKASIFTKQRGNGIGDTLIDGFWDFNNTTNVVYGTSGAVGANQSVKMQNPDSNYRWTTVSIPAHNLSGDAAFFMLIPDTNYLRTNASTYSGGSLAQFGYDVNWINNNLLYYNDGTGAASHVNNTMFIYFGGAVHTSSQQHDCYVQLPAITNPNTNGLYEVRITQDCMKWYDQEFVEFKVGNEWYSVEYNVVGIDASMQSWVSIKKGLTMPVEFAQQPNLQLRFRVQTSTRSNVYGFYYALDDIAIVPAVSEHWYGAQHQFVDGAYATIPYGMNIPLAWYGQVFNDGAQTITNAKATAWHISPSGHEILLLPGHFRTFTFVHRLKQSRLPLPGFELHQIIGHNLYYQFLNRHCRLRLLQMRRQFIQQFRRLIIFGQVAEFLHLEEVFVGEILFTEIFIDDGVIAQHPPDKHLGFSGTHTVILLISII